MRPPSAAAHPRAGHGESNVVPLDDEGAQRPRGDLRTLISGDDVALGELVVTAQKRNERLQDVPVAVTAVDGSRLVKDGTTQLTDYAAYVAGMYVGSLDAAPTESAA